MCFNQVYRGHLHFKLKIFEFFKLILFLKTSFVFQKITITSNLNLSHMLKVANCQLWVELLQAREAKTYLVLFCFLNAFSIFLKSCLWIFCWNNNDSETMPIFKNQNFIFLDSVEKEGFKLKKCASIKFTGAICISNLRYLNFWS